MTLQTLAWLSMVAYALHIMEEYTFNWRDWARAVIKLPVEWSDFYVTNAIVVAMGIAQAHLAPALPLAPLIFASLMLINAVVFHILPFVREGGRFSPGLITAVLLFFPAGIAVWWKAAHDAPLEWSTVGLAIAGGAALMAYPIVMLKLKDRPYFRQS
ncbi:HXXEE domain-containing protein [Bradyrhizobium sp. AUGA SZCCT0222]|uniref:HXXEE domain-containing protein n=1 Tax=Bradyrhizobium sp. AUGA SZCCT0222 TaxID=2807668 RepID=UPI001BA9F573|nr:HXXEE domain-containing protein [Bradyrhizobium sp. AUGA SZCCT0222]MBR1267680.1 HXXEE domain-containing protein [Bradyrhizobium sp. AUGA SZCCT0222]